MMMRQATPGSLALRVKENVSWSLAQRGQHDQGTDEAPWTRYVRADVARRWLDEAYAEAMKLRKRLETRRTEE